MLYLLLFPLLIIIAVLVLLALQPGEIAVRRSLRMRCAPEAAFAAVRDLRGWRDWSPWLLHESDAALTYSDEPDAAGGWYDWDGKIIGAGRITQVALHGPDRIEQRLVFRRPFRARSAVTWELAARDEDGAPATEIFWTMRGRLPFLLRFMAPMMSRLIGKDFELGLVLLRARLDPAAPRLGISFEPDADVPAQAAWVIPFDAGLADMKQAMEEGFARLGRAAAERGVTPAGPPFAAYHFVDATAGRFRGDIALPVPPGTDGGDLAVKTFPGGRCQSTLVQGSYDFLELAWHAVMGHLRMARRVGDRTRPYLEVYLNDPATVAADELLTRILVPVRARP